jgi:hypothetical protein
MKISPNKRYAVLTGDIVGSSKLTKAARAKLPGLIKRASSETQKAFPELVPLPVDVFRGDSWQLLVSDTARSLRVALYFRACLRSQSERGKGLDTRVAIAIGAVDFVPADRVSEGDGEAYRLSGSALEGLAASRYLAVKVAAGQLPAGLDVTVQLLDAVAQGWTGKQAQAVAGALRGWTQEKIAEKWPARISQPAVTKHLAKAFWPSVEAAVAFVEGTLTETGRE